ncbi:unnamed protein product [Ambrosiozyma monospora]|uniref:Unnamed protein product n=1 Tax=Ambrosiozyma monospora TaxID=43982 RepID=A0ACB5TQM9_AMBMO|nr:unnamed protein product [Ambrosiozyma monospora]
MFGRLTVDEFQLCQLATVITGVNYIELKSFLNWFKNIKRANLDIQRYNQIDFPFLEKLTRHIDHIVFRFDCLENNFLEEQFFQFLIRHRDCVQFESDSFRCDIDDKFMMVYNQAILNEFRVSTNNSSVNLNLMPNWTNTKLFELTSRAILSNKIFKSQYITTLIIKGKAITNCDLSSMTALNNLQLSADTIDQQTISTIPARVSCLSIYHVGHNIRIDTLPKSLETFECCISQLHQFNFCPKLCPKLRTLRLFINTHYQDYIWNHLPLQIDTLYIQHGGHPWSGEYNEFSVTLGDKYKFLKLYIDSEPSAVLINLQDRPKLIKNIKLMLLDYDTLNCFFVRCSERTKLSLHSNMNYCYFPNDCDDDQDVNGNGVGSHVEKKRKLLVPMNGRDKVNEKSCEPEMDCGENLMFYRCGFSKCQDFASRRYPTGDLLVKRRFSSDCLFTDSYA